MKDFGEITAFIQTKVLQIQKFKEQSSILGPGWFEVIDEAEFRNHFYKLYLISQ